MASLARRLQADRLKFPGMLPREIVVWRAWLRIFEREYDGFDYNVRLGRGDDPGPSFDDSIRQMAIENSKKRVDAVLFQGSRPTIVEVKDRAQASAVGQLLTYESLWLERFPTGPRPRLLLVTNRIAPDILPVLRKSGIELSIVVADFSELRPQ